MRHLVLFFTFLFFYSWNAFAHPVAQGSIKIEASNSTIILHTKITMEELVVQASHMEKPLTGEHALYDQWILHGQYILNHLSVTLGGVTINGTHHPQSTTTVPQDGGFVLYDFLFEIPESVRKSNDLQLQQSLLNEIEYAPGNRWEATFLVQASREKNEIATGLLLTSKEALQINLDESKSLSSWTVVKEFMAHGINHILTGYDHLLFVSALVLATLTLWDLILIVSAFTLAHTVTLILATFNIVRLPESVVEPMIAASIVVVAIQNVFWPQSSQGRLRLLTAFLFGLFHGLGFAGGLLDVIRDMPELSIWIALLAFSFGVEIGHQIVVLPLFAVLKTIRVMQGQSKSAITPVDWVRRGGSFAIAIAGVFYLVAALKG